MRRVFSGDTPIMDEPTRLRKELRLGIIGAVALVIAAVAAAVVFVVPFGKTTNTAELTEAGRSRTDIAAVVVGVGPGPFTGLRVGMATAAAFGDALGIPVYGVCSLDAIAADGARDLAPGAELLVVTDARRREVYSARYREDVPWTLGGIGRRVAGPEVGKPAELDTEKATVIAGSASHVDLFDLPVLPVETPSPAGLVRVAAPQVLARAVPEPLVPLYLRRPDAVEQSYRTLDRTGA
ncbi:tRNA (adenosine(37)-N6)-threonylcarbamoyltransferase complex dimerization subunit type 1 TsaB [Nocardia cyriacigeorgica]|uniref:tRNA (adenosine(37)-N6)-threonylcarbamoyltransferase complex dimerization subunit type 1 TsaB n=1 Tax=Nocardia cyriacigeorgica TaxID=135487 RepID=UPI002455F810|nr:tRNA (adenosine(37)-N6)-threonylcarbamoyltransferase complex dimerization subunit type 1 TsaB [Nocardia cyriacigeorgica]